MNVILFEDSRVEKLAPLTSLRPAFAVSCGGQTLLDAVRSSSATTSAVVRPILAELQKVEFPDVLPLQGGATVEQPTWCLNARLIPRNDILQILEHHRIHAGTILFDISRSGSDRTVVAAHVAAGGKLPASFADGDIAKWAGSLRASRQALPHMLHLLDYPHDVIRFHASLLGVNLPLLIGAGDYAEIADGVFSDTCFQPPQSWSTDTRKGPIVIQSNASIGPFTLLQGPVLIGPRAQVNEHSALKQGVSIGEYAKVGGEIEASIIESFSNKQHFGFLGHAYVGSWVNLGAGTTNSDLKNTYGSVRVKWGDHKLDTEMQFLGCMIGDYCKTSIQSTIFAGKRIGVCSMIYGQVTRNVAAFVNHVPPPGETTEISPSVIATMQQRMFRRRGREQQPHHVRLIHEAFRQSQFERTGLAARPPAFD